MAWDFRNGIFGQVMISFANGCDNIYSSISGLIRAVCHSISRTRKGNLVAWENLLLWCLARLEVEHKEAA